MIDNYSLMNHYSLSFLSSNFDYFLIKYSIKSKFIDSFNSFIDELDKFSFILLNRRKTDSSKFMRYFID
jgi:hypothetical protein